MNQGEKSGLHDSEDGHALSETIDRCTPALLEEQKDGRDTGTAPKKIRYGRIKDAHDRHGKSNHGKPEDRRVLGQHNAANAVGNRAQRLARPNHWGPYAFWRQYIDFFFNPRGHSLCLLQFWVRIAHLSDVRGARTRVQLSQQRIIARLRLEFGDAAIGIINVAENNRFRGARLLASGEDFSITNF